MISFNPLLYWVPFLLVLYIDATLLDTTSANRYCIGDDMSQESVPFVNCEQLYGPYEEEEEKASCVFQSHCQIPLSRAVCKDFPVGDGMDWTDMNGRNCKNYEELMWCTDGSWYDDQSSAAEYGVDGLHACNVCCVCGGGSTAHIDFPIGWSDNDDLDCRDYKIYRWCEDGGVGSGWNELWGDFWHYADGEYSAYEACAICGGGKFPDQGYDDQQGYDHHRRILEKMIRAKNTNNTTKILKPRPTNMEHSITQNIRSRVRN